MDSIKNICIYRDKATGGWTVLNHQHFQFLITADLKHNDRSQCNPLLFKAFSRSSCFNVCTGERDINRQPKKTQKHTLSPSCLVGLEIRRVTTGKLPHTEEQTLATRCHISFLPVHLSLKITACSNHRKLYCSAVTFRHIAFGPFLHPIRPNSIS